MTLVYRDPYDPFTLTGSEHSYVPAPVSSRGQKQNMPQPVVAIKFSQPWTPHSSVRQRGLELSAQRSHSARVVRERRRKQQQQKQDDEETIRRLSASSSSSDEHSVGKAQALHSIQIFKGLQTLNHLQGNSDPFNSYPIPVNAQINRMIVFARKSYYPALSVPPWQRNQPRKPEDALRFFELGRTSPDSTVAHLTTFGAALMRILPSDSRKEYEKAWLEVRSQALQTLRHSLSRENRTEKFAISLVQQCLYLFQGDVEGRLFSTAKIHAKTLRYLFTTVSPSPTTIFLFLTAMHSNLETACFPLQPPVMTFDDWYPQVWQGIWQNTESMLASRSTRVLTDIHPGIAFPSLQEVLLRLRLYFTIQVLGLSDGAENTKSQNDMVSLWAATRLVDDAVKLIARFLELTSSGYQYFPSNSERKRDNKRYEQHWEAMLTLTTFSNIRNYAHSSYLDDTGIDLRDASYILAPKFRETLDRLLESMSAEEEQQHDEVLFWIYFTGALFEQRRTLYRWQMLQRDKDGRSDQGEAWLFSRQLAQQARRLKVVQWSDAREILEQFALGEGILEVEPGDWWDSIFTL